MMRLRLILGLGLALGPTALAADVSSTAADEVRALKAGELAPAGEDFPFFCSIGNRSGAEAFKVVRDRRSSSGFALIYYQNYREQFWMPVSINDSRDGNKIVLYSRVRNTVFYDTAFLAMIAKTEEQGSGSEIRDVWRWSDANEWRLRPTFCRAKADGPDAR